MILPETFGKQKNTINAVIETPRGSHDKYDYDQEHDFFRLDKTLPEGVSFPLDFGFIPHTLGEDGDPLDVLVITDFTAHIGSVIECRVIGMLMAQQKEKKQKPYRNDRIVAVSATSRRDSKIITLEDLSQTFVNDLVSFFKYYNSMFGKKFKLLEKKNAHAAMKSIQDGLLQDKKSKHAA